MDTTPRWLRLLIASALLLSAALGVAAADPAPDVMVRDTTNRVLERLRGDPAIAAGDRTRIAGLVEEQILDHFDFGGMTRLAVGKYWRTIDATRRPQVVSEFRTLLVRTYSVALAEYRDQTITVAPAEIDAQTGRAVVKTTISGRGGTPIAMNYRMTRVDGQWKIYDVTVDGVSLVINYRALFGTTIEQSGVNGLIDLLEDKNRAAGQ